MALPPILDGTVPAFTKTNGTVKITVPFSMNRAVSFSSISGLYLRLKTISNEVLLTEFLSDSFSETEAVFDISDIEDKLNISQHYKVQLAYVSSQDSTSVYYSTVGITKYVGCPEVVVLSQNIELTEDFETGNSQSVIYIGQYTPSEDDINETMYSCQFIFSEVINSDEVETTTNILFDSGEIIHNSLNDNSTSQSESFEIYQDLREDRYYVLEFITTSLNGLVIDKTYKISKSPYIDMEEFYKNHTFTLTATDPSTDEASFENGYIKVWLTDTNTSEDNPTEKASVIYGYFYLMRAASDNDNIWEKIKSFNLINQAISDWEFYDYSVKQGVSYKYALQRYNDSYIFTKPIVSNTVTADFEYMFLTDVNKQLKIKYNPKMSTFKKDLLEQKIDTIGKQYPTIVRNGRVEYYEFAISGLISYLSDEDNLFLDLSQNESKYRTKTAAVESSIQDWTSTDLVSENIYRERVFKNEVLNWLSNGEVKMLRTPEEGNYLVRLISSSLSPTDSLGRMLHTFTSSAYEVEEFSLSNIEEHNFNRFITGSTVSYLSKTYTHTDLEKLNGNIPEQNITYLIIDDATTIGSPRYELDLSEEPLSTLSIDYSLYSNDLKVTITYPVVGNELNIDDSFAAFKKAGHIKYACVNIADKGSFQSSDESYYYVKVYKINGSNNLTIRINGEEKILENDTVLDWSFPSSLTLSWDEKDKGNIAVLVGYQKAIFTQESTTGEST